MIFLDLLFCNAQKKLNALTDARHSDEEIERRLAEIDEDIRNAVASSVLNRRHAPPLSHTASNRHASDTRVGLMDSTVPIEAMVSGVPHPC